MLALLLGAEGPNGRLFPADMKEFWWSTVAFLVVLALILWKLLPIMRRAATKRSERIRDELADAERARLEAESELAALRERLGNADAESQRIIADAREQAEVVRADLIRRADEEAVEARQKAELEVSASQGQVTADVQADVASQAVTAAEAVVRANLDPTAHNELIDRYIQQVSAS